MPLNHTCPVYLSHTPYYDCTELAHNLHFHLRSESRQCSDKQQCRKQGSQPSTQRLELPVSNCSVYCWTPARTEPSPASRGSRELRWPTADDSVSPHTPSPYYQRAKPPARRPTNDRPSIRHYTQLCTYRHGYVLGRDAMQSSKSLARVAVVYCTSRYNNGSYQSISSVMMPALYCMHLDLCNGDKHEMQLSYAQAPEMGWPAAGRLGSVSRLLKADGELPTTAPQRQTSDRHQSDQRSRNTGGLIVRGMSKQSQNKCDIAITNTPSRLAQHNLHTYMSCGASTYPMPCRAVSCSYSFHMKCLSGACAKQPNGSWAAGCR